MISCDWQNPSFPPMIRTSTLILSFFAAFTASGLSLGLFQVGVWANMFDQFYEETNSVLVSAERVFDGQHRCEGCEFVTDQEISRKKLFRPWSIFGKIPWIKEQALRFLLQSIGPESVFGCTATSLARIRKRTRRRPGFLSSSPFILTKRTFQLQEDGFFTVAFVNPSIEYLFKF